MEPLIVSRRSLLRNSLVLGAGLLVTPGLRLPPASARPLAHGAGPDVLLAWLDAVYGQVREERFSPTSAARAYAACFVAGYEAVVGGAPAHRSLGGQLNGLGRLPRPHARGELAWPIAANAAIATVAQAAFADRGEVARSALAAHEAEQHEALATGMDPVVVDASADHGRAVGAALAAWLDGDGYAETRGLSYDPPVGPAFWERTPPNFGAAIEPHWEQIRPFALASPDQCTPSPPVPYSEAVGSPFHEQATTVHATSLALTDEQRETAVYWRDNPDGITGLPSGHWMQIAGVVAAQRDLVEAAEILALVGIVLADAFTSCWTEKYRTNLVRPVTYIRRVMDPDWASFVNSPAFPEYTSGHSVGSGAAAHMLARLVGHRPFTDHAAAGRGFEPRSFTSFEAAAQEAAISRLYGGIHYPMAIDVGLEQGAHVSDVVLQRIRTRRGGGSG